MYKTTSSFRWKDTSRICSIKIEGNDKWKGVYLKLFKILDFILLVLDGCGNIFILRLRELVSTYTLKRAFVFVSSELSEISISNSQSEKVSCAAKACFESASIVENEVYLVPS